ncbi:SLBB domain-containing protein [Sinimarinibacterium thermocellulolyticum]|uniref:SLBB domain-containing protein n=1 Tax=Sinimarinibacterium thermocellulolyticum TaxID=3170016 RepID=A0ABV2A5G0_9GAMM
MPRTVHAAGVTALRNVQIRLAPRSDTETSIMVWKRGIFALVTLIGGLGAAGSAANVYVPQPPSGGIVEIHGAVNTPGSVLLRTTELDLAEALRAAGGLAPDAYLLGAVLLREARSAIGAAAPRDRACVGAAEQQALQILHTAVSSVKSRELAQAVYDGGRVRVPIRLSAPDLQTGTLGGVRLVAGDVLIIPPRPAYIHVGGRVARQGPVLYEPGALAENYYQAAGGSRRGWFAEDLLVLPNGEVQVLKLRFWNYQPTAIPPGSLLLFGVADPACPPVAMRR